MSSIDTLSSNTAFDNDDLEVEESYKSISRLGIFSAIFGVMGLLTYSLPPLIVLAIIGLVCGVLALRSIAIYPDEYAGKGMSRFGVILGLSTLVIAPIYHTYVYYTEVPDGYQRVDFSVLKNKYGEPDVPTETAVSLDGQRVFVKGYILPTSVSTKTFSSFIMVPDLATCCFGSEPPRTHMIRVNLTGDLLARWGFRKFKLAGTLSVDDTVVQTGGGTNVYYTLKADYIK